MISTVNAKNGLNIRKGPHIGSEVIREAAFGEELNTSLVHDNWCKGEDGYFMAKFVDIVDDVAYENVEKSPVGVVGDAAVEAAPGNEATALDKMKVPELVALAKNSGIEFRSSAKKSDIIEAILNAD